MMLYPWDKLYLQDIIREALNIFSPATAEIVIEYVVNRIDNELQFLPQKIISSYVRNYLSYHSQQGNEIITFLVGGHRYYSL